MSFNRLTRLTELPLSFIIVSQSGKNHLVLEDFGGEFGVPSMGEPQD